MITKKQRVGIVISAIWLLLAILFTMGVFDGEETIVTFSLFGVLPVIIGWGIWWIRRAKT